MEMSYHVRGTCSRILCILVFVTLPATFNFCSRDAAQAYDQDSEKYGQREKEHRKKIRRSARRAKQKKHQETARKDFTRDTTRLDYRIDSGIVKVTDTKVRDQKSLFAEMKRERKETKLEEEKLRPLDEAPSEERRRAQELRTRKASRVFLGLD